MRPIATDGVSWSVCASVCLLVTFVSPAKTAEQIEMPFGWVTGVGRRDHALYRVQIPKRNWQYLGVARPYEKHCASLQRIKSITASGDWCRWLHCFRLASVTLTSPVKNPSPAMRPLVKIIWPLVNLATDYHWNLKLEYTIHSSYLIKDRWKRSAKSGIR